MAEVYVAAKVRFNSEGREYLAQFDRGLEDAMHEIAEHGREFADSYAPVGHKKDSRTRTIREAMYTRSDANEAAWGSNARHAEAQELGGKPHLITGKVRFYWEREERWWRPGKNLINHPGNPAHPYLRPSLEQIWAIYPEILRRNVGRLR